MNKLLECKTIIISEGLPPAFKGWSDVIYINFVDIPIGTVIIRPDINTLFIRHDHGWHVVPQDSRNSDG